MTGRLIGVGVGPGDPELMTLKAARVIGEADVVAYPIANGKSSRARETAATALSATVREIGFDLPMCEAREPAQKAYDAATMQLSEALANGKTVAVLCEGDPLFYGSFMYLAARLTAQAEIEVVPGITSVSAAAAVLRQPIAARTETTAILSATVETATLERALTDHASVAILKVGRHLARVRDVIAKQGLLEFASLVANASHPDESYCKLSAAPDTAPYFSLILVTKGRDPWLS